MTEKYYMYQVKLLIDGQYKQEIRYYKKKKDLNDFDLCDVPNFHEGQIGAFIRKDAMFMGAIDIDFSKPETIYHNFFKNTDILRLPFEVKPAVVVNSSAPPKKQKRPLKPQHVPLRANVIEKDRCTYCGSILINDQRSPRFKTADHVYPVSRLGINLPSNKVPCCAFCNSFKSDYLIDEFLKRIMHLVRNYPKKKNNKVPSETTLTIMVCNVKDFINTHSVEMTNDGRYFYKAKELI